MYDGSHNASDVSVVMKQATYLFDRFSTTQTKCALQVTYCSSVTLAGFAILKKCRLLIQQYLNADYKFATLHPMHNPNAS